MQRVILEVAHRVWLKQFVPEDAGTYWGLVVESREHLDPYCSDMLNKYHCHDDVKESIFRPQSPDWLRLGIWDGEVLVGGINLDAMLYREGYRIAEVGYWLGARYEGRGYIARSLARLITYAFQATDIQRVYACFHHKNLRSQRVLERAGFERRVLLGGDAESRYYYLDRTP